MVFYFGTETEPTVGPEVGPPVGVSVVGTDTGPLVGPEVGRLVGTKVGLKVEKDTYPRLGPKVVERAAGTDVVGKTRAGRCLWWVAQR